MRQRRTLSSSLHRSQPEHNSFVMAFLGLRKWPTPVARPVAPFVAASALTYYLISTLQDMSVRSETYANDPKNPYAAQIAKEKQAHH
ncbi:hypothetical protein EW145_g4199 [Phellinidium pouzarii]|uniref:ATP synthase subunit J, mitochondrial n=1 Tax=Phellinidium pouzarii TaxID=167371 RepID=A0A4S4L4V6_9AGAM|nr:hypothetical protein EW145_g4199 [Phellinidium pouzarii]